MAALRWMIDVDGTISADPDAVGEVMRALKSGGCYVAIVTGSNPDSPSGPTWQSKVEYLKSVGVTDCWDDLVVVSGDIPAQKAAWFQQNKIDAAIDNNVLNAKAILKAGVPLVLVPWATREKK